MKYLLLFKKKKSDMFFIDKKNDFDLSKYQIYFVGCKKVVFDDKNSYMFLLHKINSFNLKNIRSVFEELKKRVFDNRKIKSVFMMKKKGFLTIEKSDLFFICFKRMKEIFIFLRREFHS